MASAPAQQSGIVLMTVILLLLLIPAAVMLLQEKSSAFSLATAARSSQHEMNYVLDAGAAHAKYMTDTNNTCSNFTNMPLTNFGRHAYQAAVVQDADKQDMLYLDITATLDNGRQSTRRVLHTAYQPAITGSLKPSQDMTIDSVNPATSYGSQPTLKISNDSGNETYGLLGFPLAGVLPPGTKINAAVLRLGVISSSLLNAVGAPDWLRVHTLARNWKETGNWNTHDGNKAWRPLGAAEPAHSDHPVTSWTGVPVLAVDIDVTDSLRNWARAQYTYYGYLLKSAQTPLTLTVASRENGNTDSRPELSIDYACPCGLICGVLPRRYYRDNLIASIDEDTGLRSCDTNYDYRGSNGDVRWSFSPWQENGDDGLSCSGELSLEHDSLSLDADSYQLKLAGNGSSLQRTAWLEDAELVTVSFDYRRHGLINVNQRLHLKVSNGGGLITVLSIDGGATDAEYQTASADLPPELVGPYTTLELVTENLNGLSYYYVDNVRIGFDGFVTPPFSLPVTADTYLNLDKPDDRFAAVNPVKLKDSPDKQTNVAGLLSTYGLYPGEIVSKASLRLWVADNRSDREATISFYALTEDWHSNEVTWRDRQRNVIAWSTPGGSYALPADPADVPTVVLQAEQKNLWVEFDISPWVQGWHDIVDSNKGFLLIMDDTGRGKDIKITSTENGDPGFHPHVELEL